MPSPLYYPQLQTVDAVPGFHAARDPAAVALCWQDQRLTYTELEALSRRSAAALQRDGLKPGARVAYLGKESPRYYELLFACAHAGLVLVPINWRLAATEIDHILRDSCTTVLFVEREFLTAAELVRASLPALKGSVLLDAADYAAWRDAGSAVAVQATHRSTPDTPIAQIYTSGTTGLPKGVVLAHRSFFKVRDGLASAGLDWIDWLPGDVSLVAVPGFHIGGLWWAMQGFNAGITNVAMRWFVSQDAVALIRRHRVTTVCAVPSMLQMMLAERGVTRDDFESLRKVVYGGSPISETLLERGLAMMNCDFAQIYGLSESGNTAVCLPPSQHVPGSPRMKAAGRPYPNVALKVVDADGNTLAPGDIGEVCLKSPAQMIEYWQLPEATAKTVVDGWLHTGDAGFVDDEGYVTICDRLKDMIIVGGEKVYPAEVENAIAAHPAVAEVAVVGVPDERWGEAVQAFVVLNEGQAATPRELMLAMKGRIADFKLPTRYEFIERVPRNPSGKVLRRELRDRYWQGRDRQVN